jgi:hypothetical protein
VSEQGEGDRPDYEEGGCAEQDLVAVRSDSRDDGDEQSEEA